MNILIFRFPKRFLLAVAVGIASCHHEATPPNEVGADFPVGLDRYAYVDALGDRAMSAAELAFGEALFKSTALSADGKVSCASCHDPAKHFVDGERFSSGSFDATGSVHTPTVVNRAFGRRHFWDGRADSLEEQALGPLFSDCEMQMTPELLVQSVQQDRGLSTLFRGAFDSPVEPGLIAQAMATFQLSIVAGDSDFDRYEWQGDSHGFGPDAAAGLDLFRGKAKCSLCHIGPNFSDEELHDIALAPPAERTTKVLRLAKTPTLRNVKSTAPYMHDGRFSTLREVLDHYNSGGHVTPGTGPIEIDPLNLTDPELEQLEAFLESLSGPVTVLAASTIQELREASQ